MIYALSRRFTWPSPPCPGLAQLTTRCFLARLAKLSIKAASLSGGMCSPTSKDQTKSAGSGIDPHKSVPMESRGRSEGSPKIPEEGNSVILTERSKFEHSIAEIEGVSGFPSKHAVLTPCPIMAAV